MLNNLNEMIKKFDVIDIGLIKLAVLLATIIIVKLFPQLMSISYSILIILVIICAARPAYRLWIKK
jgi:hypothetical protein